jgi:hypothetical protein
MRREHCPDGRQRTSWVVGLKRAPAANPHMRQPGNRVDLRTTIQEFKATCERWPGFRAGMAIEISSFKHDAIPEYLAATVIPEPTSAEADDPAAAVEGNREEAQVAPAAVAAAAARTPSVDKRSALTPPQPAQEAAAAAAAESGGGARAASKQAGASAPAATASGQEQAPAAANGRAQPESTQAQIRSRDPPQTNSKGDVATSAAAPSAAPQASSAGPTSRAAHEDAYPTKIDVPSSTAHDAAVAAMQQSAASAGDLLAAAGRELATVHAAAEHGATLAPAHATLASSGVGAQGAAPAPVPAARPAVTPGADAHEAAPIAAAAPRASSGRQAAPARPDRSGDAASGAAVADPGGDVGGAEVWVPGVKGDAVERSAHEDAANGAAENGHLVLNGGQGEAQARGRVGSAGTSESPSKRKQGDQAHARSASKRHKASNSPPADGVVQ